MSFEEESRRIKKGQVKMRNIQQPTGDQPKRSSEYRKLIKPRNRKMGTTPDREMAEGDFEARRNILRPLSIRGRLLRSKTNGSLVELEFSFVL
jgi:hypothetical protein